MAVSAYNLTNMYSGSYTPQNVSFSSQSPSGVKATVQDTRASVDPAIELANMKIYECMYKTNLEVIKAEDKKASYILDLQA